MHEVAGHPRLELRPLHVLKKLLAYAPLVGKGECLIYGGAIVEYMLPQLHVSRPWRPENNPATVIKEFLAETDWLIEDKKIDYCLLFSCDLGGYLQPLE